LIYVVGRFLWEGGGVPGFSFLASVIALFSGAQLFALGIIGEYLARMHFRSMGRPSSVVRETVGLYRNGELVEGGQALRAQSQADPAIQHSDANEAAHN
jgi:hypothetical protein